MLKNKYEISKYDSLRIAFFAILFLIIAVITAFILGYCEAKQAHTEYVQKLNTGSFTVIDSVIYTGKDGFDYLIIISEELEEQE